VGRDRPRQAVEDLLAAKRERNVVQLDHRQRAVTGERISAIENEPWSAAKGV
jgi:hypothetical protein